MCFSIVERPTSRSGGITSPVTSSRGSSAPPTPPPKPARPPPEEPKFRRLDPSVTTDNHRCLELGTLVELCSEPDGDPVFGVVRWIGWLPEYDRSGVGVELVSGLGHN
jgi:hypothetical protein